MDKFMFLVLFAVAMAFPIYATDVTEGDVIDGNYSVSDPTTSTDASDPSDLQEATPDAVVAAETEEDASVLAVSGALAGGYYFVCDCALGYDLMFYVPNEWAHDALTFDGSGEVVNLSTSTCYLYCPDYPDYTFSASRFGTFSYRASNYNTTDLEITNISDTNISFFEEAAVPMSQTDFNILSCSLLLILACLTIFKRGS